MIKAIFFDLGGVLVIDIFPLMESYVSGICGKPYSQVKEARKLFWLDYELGRMDGLEFMQRWMDELGADIGAEELLAKSIELITLKEETVSILKRIKESNRYLLGVISNNTDEWAEHAEKELGLEGYFDAWVISSHHHIKKPDKEIYDFAAEQLGLKVQDCLFIDNTQRQVDGAIAAGMQAIRFRDAKQLEEDLKKSGIEF